MNGGSSRGGQSGPGREAVLSASLLQCTKSILLKKDLEESARVVFEHCRDLTGARAGYIAVLGEDGRDNRILHLDAGGLPCTVDSSLPMPLRGFRAEACRSGKVLVENSFAGSPWEPLLPGGHVAVGNVLFAPLVVEGKVLGLLGLANKEGGFTAEDEDIAACFADLGALVLSNSMTRGLLEEGRAALARLNAGLEGQVKARTAELEEANAHLRAQSGLLAAISRIQSGFIAEADPAGLFEELLGDLLSLTGSECGVVGEVLHDDKGSPYVRAFAMTGASKDGGPGGGAAARPCVRLTDPDTLLGAVVRSGETVICNDASAEACGAGLPPGQHEVRSFMGLPIHSGLQMVGMAGVANAEGGYSAGTAAFLEPLLRVCGNIILGLRAERLRHVSEKGLQEQKEFLRGVMEALSQPLLVIDVKDHTIVMANEAAGGAAAEGSTCHSHTHGSESPCGGEHLCPMAEIRRTGRPVTVEHLHHDADGTLRPFAVRGYPIFGVDGEVSMIIEYNIDLSEQRKRERELTRSRAEFEAIFNAISDAVVFVDTERRAVLVNPAFTRTFGYTLEEIRGKQTRFIYADPADFTSQGKERFSPDATPTDTVYEMRYRRKDGTVFVSETLGTKVTAPDGSVMGFIGVIRDISERKRLEEQLSHAQRLESIGEMAGGVAHDFNNILAGILGNASLLKLDLEEKSPSWEQADTIEKSARRGADLTARLLAFARKVPLDMVPVDVNGVVGDLLKIIPQIFDRSVEIRTVLAPGLPTVKGDPSHLSQVIMNLCLNARDAMPGGGSLTITTSLRKEAEGSHVVVSVIDTGAGMDEKTRSRIFDPFFTTKEQGKGTGLGLSVAYGVVKNHGGFIEVESGPGSGSILRVCLPAYGGLEKRETAEDDLPRGGGELVLVVDDEEVVRRMVGRVLQRYGYRVVTARDGVDAVEIYRREGKGIDLVLLDIVMPRLGGRETFLELRRIDPAVRVLFSSGYSKEEKLTEYALEGVLGFVQKPYQVGQLLRAVRDALAAA